MIGEATTRRLEEIHPATAGWALSCCRWDREEAEEVLQMTYLKVLDGRARFDDRSSFKTWLFGVVRRTAAERRRSRWMRAVAGLRWRDGRPSPPPVPTPESRLAARPNRRAREACRLASARCCISSSTRT
jgi:DNA-directed RNA polymerase specialized sigma24 family protein